MDLKRDFPNLEFRTYQSFTNLSSEEITNIDCDLLVLDEFHHIGAPVWGDRINTMVETHPEMKIFGMTAYTVRGRGTSYERDMANPDTNELFSGKIESRYDLCDAMMDGVLPKPIYKSAYTNLIGMESKLEEKVRNLDANTREYQKYMAILGDVKRRIHEAPGISDVLKRSMKPNGKYIYFCPPYSEDGTNNIETIKEQATQWFRDFVPLDDIVIYTSTSKMKDKGKLNREAFYDDVTLDGKSAKNKLRVMFAINQYNEGIHAPDVDGVIMGRGTTSDIVYFEQLGRALSVRGDTKDRFEKLEKYSKEQLIDMCLKKDILIKDDMSKEEIIEKLVAPIVIDLTNNYGFIKELENNLRDRIKDIEAKGLRSHNRTRIRDASFDIEIENQDLFEMLRYVMDRLTMKWEDYYELAKTYYEHHGNLEIPQSFKTINGYEFDENGISLGTWIKNQRRVFKGNFDYKLSDKRIELLKQVGMRFETNKFAEEWNKKYELAKVYYNHHGDLEIPQRFKTTNGYDYDENGISLGSWISVQRQAFNGKKGTINEEQIGLLKQIGMRFGNKSEKEWNKKYELAKAYYEHYGNLEIPQRFKTTNGYDYDENGISLGRWIDRQRKAFNGKKGTINEEQIGLLKQIGMRFGNKSEKEWNKKYELAKVYYEHYGNLEITASFRTINGYDYDENGISLGIWIHAQRQAFSGKKGTMNEEQIGLLKQIGMRFEANKFAEDWNKRYELAKAYYEHYGNLEVPARFKTINGYDYDENGISLGTWLNTQRQAFNGKKGTINEEQIGLLKQIGMRFGKEWNKKYELAKVYYNHHGDLEIPQRFKTINGYDYDENGISLGSWISVQRQAFNGKGSNKISEEEVELLKQIGMRFGTNKLQEEWNKKYELAKAYYEHYGNLEVPQKFKTINGYDYDENGISLGAWMNTQRLAFNGKGSSKISEEEVELLKQIGMRFGTSKLQEEWNKKYELAKAYYNHHGDLEIPQKFKTTNGYDYDENGISLGSWISIQRQAFNGKGTYKISDERIKLLDKIGMKWFLKNKKEETYVDSKNDLGKSNKR